MAGSRTKRFLLTGLAALLPTMLTLYLVYYAVITIHSVIGLRLNKLFGISETSLWVFVGDAIAFAAFMFLMWLAGFLLATYIGRSMFRRMETMFRRLPIVRLVYPALKQVTDFFLAERTLPFSRVVAAEYPRRGMYALGFATSEGIDEVRAPDGERLITVFIPSTPAPLTGFTVFVRRSEVIFLNISVDHAIKLIVSGGVVVPDMKVAAEGAAVPALGAGPPAPEPTARQEG